MTILGYFSSFCISVDISCNTTQNKDPFNQEGFFFLVCFCVATSGTSSCVSKVKTSHEESPHDDAKHASATLPEKK